MAQAKVPAVLSVPQKFCVTVKVAAEAGMAETEVASRLEGLWMA